MSLLNTLEQHLASLAFANTQDVVVAYSGGVDSHVLLHALVQLQQKHGYLWQLRAIHIHHGLSQHADSWQAHCQQVCEDLAVPLQTAKVKLEVKSRQSLEALAREKRYQKLIELAPTASQILLGQHQDDQLETFMLQLKRGAGPKGLSAMNASWQIDSPKPLGFYRPLLAVSQQQILAYAQAHELSWCEDESNQDTEFDRNFLRHQVLPLLINRWPELASTVSRSASLCAEQQTLLEESCEEKLQQMGATQQALPCQALLALSDAWLKQVVRYWLSKQGVSSPSQAVLNRLKPEVLAAKDDAKPILQWQNWQFRRFQQALYLVELRPQAEPFNLLWQGEAQVSLPNGLGRLTFTSSQKLTVKPKSGVCINPKNGPINIRLGGFSLKFKPFENQPSKPLKQWFKEWNIPPWQREQAILLVQNEQLQGLWLAQQFWPAHQSTSLDNAYWVQLTQS
ncbi:tRNA lysidine(34) synthetase TilS [Paraglaciecola aestuariivivens]